jgi:hypothetical protein
MPGTGLCRTECLDGRDPTKSWRKMDMEQTPFEPGKIGFADNPEPQSASVLLLDVSGSTEEAIVKANPRVFKLYKRYIITSED